MDLGIAGRRAIVCASSLGLGRACAVALAKEGVHVVLNGRHQEELAATHSEIAGSAQSDVTSVVADVTTRDGRDAILDACPEPDILITNCGGPPASDFRELTHDDWINALNANMLSALDLIRATVYGMMDRSFGRVVNITSHAVKAPAIGLDLSNGARMGLTGAVGRPGQSDRETQRDHQQPTAGILQHPPNCRVLRKDGRPDPGRGREVAGGRRPCKATVRSIRRPVRVRCYLRLFVQCARSLHKRSETS